MASTHNGTCQICGRLQALPSGIAKHGYTVERGYFEGVCPGSHEQPLELSREFADRVAADLDVDSRNHARDAILAERGEILPTRAKSGATERYQHQLGYWATRDVIVDYELAPPVHQRAAREALVRKHTATSKLAADTAKAIRENADRVYQKQPLQPRVAEQTASQAIGVGTVVRLFGKDGFDVTVIEIKNCVAHGCGPNLNGRMMPHIVYERNGKLRVYPTRLIRKTAIK